MQKAEYLRMHTQRVWQGSRDYWYTYFVTDGERKLVKKKFKTDLEKAIVDFYSKGGKYSPTFKECFDEWSKKKLEYNEIQRQSYDRYQSDYKRFLVKFGQRKIKNIGEEDLYEFILSTIRDENLTAKGWSGLRTLLLGTFKYAKRMKYTDLSITTFMSDIDISRGVYRKRNFKDAESVFTDEEIDVLRKKIEEENDNLLNLGVLLAFETGLRAGEISALEYSDLKDNVLTVDKTEIHYKEDGKYHYEIRTSTKGKYDERFVVLLPQTVELIERIHRMNPNGQYLFEKDGKRIISKCFTSRLYRLCRMVGIKPRSMHKCRKTYVSQLCDAGVPKKVICGQVGHTDFSTTENHYWFNRKSVDDIQEMLINAVR